MSGAQIINDILKLENAGSMFAEALVLAGECDQF
jgi:hypothetical protein